MNMKKTLREFKVFITKGNVFDLAVALIIGSAFGKIVTSFVNDLFMPLLGLILGGNNITALKVVLKPAVGEDGVELAIRYGMFIRATIDFLLIALVIFAMIKLISKFKKKEEEKPVAPLKPSNEEVLLAEIRDLLKDK
jgi:large conductance mechanosensitive channel